MSKKEEKNPYNDEKGIPKMGFVEESFAWARKKELERQSKLTPEEQNKIRAAEEHLAKKMNF